MKIRTLAIIAISLFFSINIYAWGPKGHAIVADIAQHHLNKNTAKKVSEVLDGQTMVSVASWMDGLRGKQGYEYVYTWHFLNVDPGLTYDTAPKEPKGDVYSKLITVVDSLKSGKLSQKKEKDLLRYVIHMVADMHCPMHAGYKYDSGGNARKLMWFDKETSLHSVWDSKLLESAHAWSYSEWTANLDIKDKAKISEITSSDLAVWREQTLAFRDTVYAASPAGAKLSYAYVDQFTAGAERQLLNAGLRLARILNEIYK
ncbi:MAG: S1/P1 nuclease [Flavobacteriales bacterium]|nr:S1/P1 nuclease [Flavobacteriales bacterium]